MTVIDPLRVAVVSLDIAAADKEANLSAACEAIRHLRDVDVAVLPELFSTGFVADARATRQLAEAVDGVTIKTITRIAKETGIALCGSFICSEDSKIFNRCFFVTPEGEITTYDKHHLFILGAEPNIYTPGSSTPPIINYLGWKISMACCYDLRFPCWLRNRTVNDSLSYDVMLIPANWPNVRRYAWHHLLVARAIENQAYYVGANRSGEDPYGTYTDNSEIVNYDGKPIGAPFACALSSRRETEGNRDEENVQPEFETLRAELSLSRLKIQRRAFPFWQSAD